MKQQTHTKKAPPPCDAPLGFNWMKKNYFLLLSCKSVYLSRTENRKTFGGPFSKTSLLFCFFFFCAPWCLVSLDFILFFVFFGLFCPPPPLFFYFLNYARQTLVISSPGLGSPLHGARSLQKESGKNVNVASPRVFVFCFAFFFNMFSPVIDWNVFRRTPRVKVQTFQKPCSTYPAFPPHAHFASIVYITGDFSGHVSFF